MSRQNRRRWKQLLERRARRRIWAERIVNRAGPIKYRTLLQAVDISAEDEDSASADSDSG